MRFAAGWAMILRLLLFLGQAWPALAFVVSKHQHQALPTCSKQPQLWSALVLDDNGAIDTAKSDTEKADTVESSEGESSASTATTTTPTTTIRRSYETWHWQPENKNRTFRINYRVEGPKDGRPILLTHGFGANINHFRHNIPALVEAGYRVYAMDLLGFGASEKPARPTSVGFSIELFTRQMIDFCEGRQAETSTTQPWVLVGNSIGGLCSLAVASEQDILQFDLAALVLLNSAGGMTGFRYKDLPLWSHPIMGHLQYSVLRPQSRGGGGRQLYKLVAQRQTIQLALTRGGIYQDTTNVDDDLLDMLLEPAMDEGSEQVFLSVVGGPAGPTRESLLPKVTVPVLALWGEEDPFTPFDDDVRALPPLHGNNDFVLKSIPNAGHCLHDEHPKQVNAMMLQFLQERGLV